MLDTNGTRSPSPLPSLSVIQSRVRGLCHSDRSPSLFIQCEVNGVCHSDRSPSLCHSRAESAERRIPVFVSLRVDAANSARDSRFRRSASQPIRQSKRSIHLTRQLDHPHHRIDIQLAIQMRKHFTRLFTPRTRRRLISQLHPKPLLLNTQNNQPTLPAIKSVRSCDHLRQSRAMNKPLRRQTIGYITPKPNGLNPLTLTNNMKDHPRSLEKTQSEMLSATFRDSLLNPGCRGHPCRGGVEPTAVPH